MKSGLGVGLETWGLAVLLFFLSVATRADSLRCNLDAYRAQPGLNAAVADETLTITWLGEQKTEFRIQFVVSDGMPYCANWPFVSLREIGGSSLQT